jgi:hypothetical protein
VVPGSHKLAFNTQQTFEGPGLFLFDDLHLVDADALTLTTLLPAGRAAISLFPMAGKLPSPLQQFIYERRRQQPPQIPTSR